MTMFMMEDEIRRLDQEMRELQVEGKLTKCRCGWPRMRKRLKEGSVVQFCNNRECPDFREDEDNEATLA